jgi:REP element-mobilizing transposase RayT
MLAAHIIVGAYGFWLPNDPRGSWSEFVGSFELHKYGKATKVDVRRSVAAQLHDTARRKEAKTALKHDPVKFNGVQARAIGRGFASYVEKSGIAVHACAILPDHLHLVVARHRLAYEHLTIALKGAATRRLNEEGIHPLTEHQGSKRRPPKCFARGQWVVFLNTDEDVWRAIAYVEMNPLKEGKPLQRWAFVTPFGGALR